MSDEVQFVLHFSPSLPSHISDALATYIAGKLENNFVVQKGSSRHGQLIFLVVSATNDAIEAEAESTGILKENTRGRRSYFQVCLCHFLRGHCMNFRGNF